MILDGVKVVELATMWAAPGSAMYLADQGADVIKVEPPGGDEARRLFTSRALGNESPSFFALNRNKRGICVDLTKPEGLEIVDKLVEKSDVLIQNYRPMVAERLGVAYERLIGINPRLIYAELSGYGKKGPYAEKGAYDLMLQALAGIMHRRTTDGTPVAAGIWAADCSTPMMLAYGISLGLYNREKTGKGTRFETSLLNTALAMQHVDLVKTSLDGKGERAPTDQASFSPYRCADGQWLLPVALSDKEWVKMCIALAIPHLATDERYAVAQARAENTEELYGLLAGLYETKTREQWLTLLHAHDVPAVPIMERAEVLDSEQVIANDMRLEMDHPVGGRITTTNTPLRFPDHPPSHRSVAPLQGQDTDPVLLDLGYQPKELESLREAGVIS